MRPFYVTTPIYYVNDRPHIGTAYSTLAADTLARYARLRGRKARFLTGTDEHGQKIERRAKAEGKTPQAFVDEMARPFREAWGLLACAGDDFIRTTEPRHEARVQELWRRCEKNGDIYLGDYEGWYCVADEAFYTEKELVDGKSPTGRPVERVKEPSFFFRLSRYTDKLLAFYAEHPSFVRPEGRFNEVKSFVREGLKDLSISRTSFSWGIPVPGHAQHVMYVWFDALTNYISALGGPAAPGEAPLFDEFWEPRAEVVHIVGKDILRFHAAYWPALLLSAGLEPPTQIFAHGWLTVDGAKMSKSSGNFIAPEPIARALGPDVLRYYLLREIALGQDGDFSHKNLIARYHGDLGNGLGNLSHRVLASLVKKSFAGKVPARGELEEIDRELQQQVSESLAQAATDYGEIAPHRALEHIFEAVGAANRYVDRTAPWTLAKDPARRARLGTVCWVVLDVLRALGAALSPVLPHKSAELYADLGLPPLVPVEGTDQWPVLGALAEGLTTSPDATLFPRLDPDREKAVLLELVPHAPVPPAAAAPAGPPKAGIAIEDFAKIELRVGVVRTARRVPRSDKLLELSVDVGDAAPRTILAGLGKRYAPEELVLRHIVVIVNLAPRKMMGLESRGMVLAAKDDKGPCVVLVDESVAPGSPVQ